MRTTNLLSYIQKTGRALFLGVCVFGVFALSSSVNAQNDPEFQIIPEADPSEYTGYVEELGNSEKTHGKFFIKYNKFAEELNEGGDKNDNCPGLGKQIASGIMNRDTILCMVSKLVRFIANMALVVGGLMVIYAGYSYAVAVFTNNSTVDSGGKAIKRAVTGIVVIVFAYAILKFLISAFL